MKMCIGREQSGLCFLQTTPRTVKCSLLNLVILEHKCVFSLPQGVNQNIP